MRLPLLIAPLLLSTAPEPMATELASGMPEAAHAVPVVRVPFGCGLSFPVSQAHETGSHLQHDAWAWDFRMPEGTPVVAAYDGVVRLARGDSARGGCDPRFAPMANYVVIDHQNGLETQYLHFSKVVVRQGDRIKAGDLLGYSGKTGWACGAHLHFKVARAKTPGWNNPSVQARIAGFGDPQVDAEVSAPPCDRDKAMQAVNRAVPASGPPAPAAEPVAADSTKI